MIVYHPRQWTEVLFGIHRSPVLRKILGGVVLIGGYSLAVTHLTRTGALVEIPFKPSLFPLVTVLLSLLLAFRTNTAYDRWWEGRRLWQALVDNSRNLAIFLDSTLPSEDDPHRQRFAALISAYALAVRGHLQRGVDFDELVDLDPPTLARLRAVEHVPNHIASAISRGIYDLAKEDLITGFELVNLKAQVAELTEITGGCERIKTTPIPFSYAVFERHLLGWFCVALPWGLQGEHGYMTVPLTMVAFAALAGLEMLAVDIEDPFGTDDSDLSTGRLAHMIRRNVHELLTGRAPADDPVPQACDDLRVER